MDKGRIVVVELMDVLLSMPVKGSTVILDVNHPYSLSVLSWYDLVSRFQVDLRSGHKE